VLVDAPCTGTGAIRRRPWSRWAVHVADLQRLPPQQLDILQRASSWVGDGGRLVYATCSLLAEENEEVVARFLQKNPDWQLQPTSTLLGEQRADEIGSSGVLRLYPHLHGTDAFYAAVLTRS
jgi:16S rRNA (cytosine967-C5)-methyltransferase